MSVKTVNTRIKSKYDLLATWQSSTLEILPGEITVAYLPTRVSNPGQLQTTKPSFLLKVGVDFPTWVASTSYGVGDTVTYNSTKYRCVTANSDASFTASKWSANHTGTSTAIQYGLYWSELPFTSALAADVYSWAKAENKPTYGYTEITNFATGVQLNDHQYKIVETSTGSGKFDLKVSTDNGSTWSAVSGSAQIDISALDTDTNTIYRFNSTQPTTGVYQLQLESQEKGSSTWNVVSNSSFQIKESTSSGKITIVTTNTSGTSVSVDIPVHNVVTTDGAQTISGNKTFTGTVTVPSPSNSTDAANKSYVDSQIAKIDQFKYHVSTAAADTPYGVQWSSVTGTLKPSYDTEFTIYLVPDDGDPHAPGIYIEYLTVCVPVAAWAANTAYAVGDIVSNGGNSYYCKTAHTSSSSFDSSKWDLVQVDSDAPAWAASTAYKIGDEVVYSGKPYVCTTAHTSSSSWDSSKWALAGYRWERIGTTSTDLSNYSTKKYQGKLTTSTSSNVTTVTYSVQQSEISTTSWSNIGDVFTYTVNSSTGVITLSDGTTTYTKAALDAKISTVTITDTPQYTRGVDNDGVQISSVTNGTTKTSTALMYADMYIFDCGTSTINTSGS